MKKAVSEPSGRAKVNVTTGIRRDCFGYEAYVTVGGKQFSRRFPPGSRLSTMQAWRLETQREQQHRRRLQMRVQPRTLPKALDGWCYIYFIRSQDMVKIGCTENPTMRLSNLQTAHPWPLTMLAAVPAHAALEPEIHQRFAVSRQAGEWFQLTAELEAFIRAVAAGQNPVALLFEPPDEHEGRAASGIV